ncbi:hypothetical protein RJT34_16012 [Clitoria ternatea]|uniref:Uncharacterized protein n=1 Tax=Clitoria ternatea TaxID=43366 RepID=A0AAN9PCI5_CLITE
MPSEGKGRRRRLASVGFVRALHGSGRLVSSRVRQIEEEIRPGPVGLVIGIQGQTSGGEGDRPPGCSARRRPAMASVTPVSSSFLLLLWFIVDDCCLMVFDYWGFLIFDEDDEED